MYMKIPLLKKNCHINYHKDGGGKYCVFLYILTILTEKKKSKFCLSLWTTVLQKLHVTFLSLASVNRINALGTMQDYFI